MPVKSSWLSEYCEGPAGCCDVVKFNCKECKSTNKERAEKKQQESVEASKK